MNEINLFFLYLLYFVLFLFLIFFFLFSFLCITMGVSFDSSEMFFFVFVIKICLFYFLFFLFLGKIFWKGTIVWWKYLKQWVFFNFTLCFNIVVVRRQKLIGKGGKDDRTLSVLLKYIQQSDSETGWMKERKGPKKGQRDPTTNTTHN